MNFNNTYGVLSSSEKRRGLPRKSGAYSEATAARENGGREWKWSGCCCCCNYHFSCLTESRRLGGFCRSYLLQFRVCGIRIDLTFIDPVTLILEATLKNTKPAIKSVLVFIKSNQTEPIHLKVEYIFLSVNQILSRQKIVSRIKCLSGHI